MAGIAVPGIDKVGSMSGCFHNVYTRGSVRDDGGGWTVVETCPTGGYEVVRVIACRKPKWNTLRRNVGCL